MHEDWIFRWCTHYFWLFNFLRNWNFMFYPVAKKSDSYQIEYPLHYGFGTIGAGGSSVWFIVRIERTFTPDPLGIRFLIWVVKTPVSLVGGSRIMTPSMAHNSTPNSKATFTNFSIENKLYLNLNNFNE